MKTQKKSYKIMVNREKCNGCGICAKLCPKNWKILDSKAHAKKIFIEKLECNSIAEKHCPKGAITIKEVD